MLLVFAPYPALERVALAEKFAPGVPQKPPRVITWAGGSGLRAASVIRLLGGEPLAVGFAGGRIGELLQEALDRQNVPHALTRTASETHGAFLLLDRETGVVSLIHDPPPVVSVAETDKLLASLSRHLPAASHVLLTGDDGAAQSIAPALAGAHAANVAAVCDLKGLSLAAGLTLGGMFLLRVSHKSLQRHLERSLIHDSAIVREANALRDAHDIAHVVVTLGEDGAILVSERGATRVKAPVVSHFNPVGGGQTLVGALLTETVRNGGDLVNALRYGCAAASVNVTHDEPGYATPGEIAVILPKTTALPVMR